MELFEPAKIGKCTLPNRILRSATYEGMCDDQGVPTPAYYRFYEQLAGMQIGAIITGFAYISRQGRAMQPGQAGIDSPDKIPHFKKLTGRLHESNSRIFIQLAHAGRQSSSGVTREALVSSGNKPSNYFREQPRMLSKSEIHDIIEQFGKSALYAKKAGFDGVQLHAAHGYLVHQFLSPAMNNRKDAFGTDKSTGIGTKFLELVVRKIRSSCGNDYPLILKISGSDDYRKNLSQQQFRHLIRAIDGMSVDAVEISYGTMDYALNIMRGDFPEDRILRFNPFYKGRSRLGKMLASGLYFPIHKRKLKKFTPAYNLNFATIAKTLTDVPIISVGGYRRGMELQDVVQQKEIDFVSLCRPFIAEPDLVGKIKSDLDYVSRCTNCNCCSVMCDSKIPTKCYKNKSYENTRESH